MKGAREGAIITKIVGRNQHELTVDAKTESKKDAGGQRGSNSLVSGQAHTFTVGVG
jgi:hypothetical protein